MTRAWLLGTLAVVLCACGGGGTPRILPLDLPPVADADATTPVDLAGEAGPVDARDAIPDGLPHDPGDGDAADDLPADLPADPGVDPGSDPGTPDVGPDPGDLGPVDPGHDPGPDTCTPACTGKACGPDGCGGQCGACPAGTACSTAGQCVCTPACTGKACGPDGCGGQCGTCPAGTACNGAGQCVCTPACTGKACGPDGCGGQCGTCPSGWTCQSDGTCRCVASCAGRECGSDGCGGTCGACGLKEVCLDNQCIPTDACASLPKTWQPASAATGIAVASAAADVARCPDFTGDGKGDSALAPFASYLDPYIGGTTAGMLFEFVDAVNVANSPPFKLNGLQGAPAGGGGTTWNVFRTSYGPDCKPFVTLPATITNQNLAAGPGRFLLVLPLGSGYMAFVLSDTRIAAYLTSGGKAGVAGVDGVLGGVLTKEEMANTFAAADQQCAGPNPPSYCGSLSMLEGFLPSLSDVDLDGDGSPDALSLCVTFDLKAVKIGGVI